MLALRKLRQRGAQVGEQVSEQARRLRRVGLGEVLDRCQRVEQEVRLDLRLHQLQLGFERQLGEPLLLRFGAMQRRLRRASRGT